MLDLKFSFMYIYFNGLLRIALTFFKLDLWSPGEVFIPIISIKGINQIKKGNCKKKKVLCIQKDLIYF